MYLTNYLVLGLAVTTLSGVVALAELKDPLLAIEDPVEFARALDKVLEKDKKHMDKTLVQASQNYIAFLAINDKLQSTCNSYSIRWVKAVLLSARLAIQLSHLIDEQGRQRCYKIAKMTEKVLFKHSELCQPIYEQKYETFDPDLRHEAEEFGRDFVYHLLSVDELGGYCAAHTGALSEFNRANSDQVDSCVLRKSSTLLSMYEQMDDLVGPTVVFRMLYDYSRDDPERASFLEATKKSYLNGLVHFERDPQYSDFYKRYLTGVCKRISALGSHLFRPIEFDRMSTKPTGGVHEMKSKSKEFIYAWMAYSVCENYILKSRTLKLLPDIVEAERKAGRFH